MKKTCLSIAVFLFLLSFFSCKKEFTDSFFTFVLLEGDNQTGNPNELLPKEVVVQVLRDGKPFFSAPVMIEKNSGFVNASTPSNFSSRVASTDAVGKVRLKWTLGCLGTQEMKLKLGSPGCSQLELVNGTCTSLGEITVRATASSASGWTKACGFSNFFVNFDRNSTKFIEAGDDLFVLTNNNVFVSSNDGVDWEAVNTPFGTIGSFTSAFSVDEAGAWYMAVFGNGVFKSTNRGASWSSITNNIFFSQPNKIFVKDDIILVNDANNGLFRSANNGANWVQVTVGGSFFGNFDQIVETPDGKLWTWDNNSTRLAKSSDKGETWQNVTNPLSLNAFPATYMTANADGHIFYLYSSGPKLMDYNPATNTGTVKSFLNNPTGTNFVAFFQQIDGVNYVNTYSSNSLGVFTGTGTGTYTKLDLGTSEDVEVFYRTKKERLLIGNSKGLFVKL